MENEKQFNVGENLKAFTFEDRLKQVISESGLPVSTIYFILSNALANIKGLYEQQVNTEYNEYNEHMKAQEQAQNEEPAKTEEAPVEVVEQ